MLATRFVELRNGAQASQSVQDQPALEMVCFCFIFLKKIAIGLSYFFDVVEGGKRDCKRNHSFELADFACSLD